MDQQTRVRVSENGRVVIPASFRGALGIQIGDEVVLELKHDELRITTQQQRIQRASQRARKYLPAGGPHIQWPYLPSFGSCGALRRNRD
jgi:AbrB family looped-hinge helix DNA binding protein